MCKQTTFRRFVGAVAFVVHVESFFSHQYRMAAGPLGPHGSITIIRILVFFFFPFTPLGWVRINPGVCEIKVPYHSYSEKKKS
jgi:hypothetical protein